MDDFKDAVAIITGGGSGIGLGTAEALLVAGAKVALLGHDREQIDAAAKELENRFPGCVWGLQADVRDLEALDVAVQSVVRRTGRIDHLVCAAGIQIPGTAVSAAEADWLNVIDTNLSGAFRACKAVLPSMIAGGGGSIVVVSSIQAVRGKPNGVAYVAAKGGLNAMVRAMALDHAGQGVRVNAVCPGVVDTPMLRQAASRRGSNDATLDALVEKWAATQPIDASVHRPCRPADVAEAILFLLSRRATFVTGAEILIDGGLGAKLPL